MDEIKLLEFKIEGMEKNFLKIVKNLNERLNILEDKLDDFDIDKDTRVNYGTNNNNFKRI